MKRDSLRLSGNLETARLVFRTATMRDTLVVFTGNLVSAVLGAIFFFLLARLAGPAGLGAFAVVTAVAVTAVDLFDIAINAAIVNFASREEGRALTLTVAFRRKLVLAAVTAAVLWLVSPVIAVLVSQPELTGLLRVAVLLVPAKALFSFVRAALQSARRFGLDAAIDVGSAGARLGGFLLGVWAGGNGVVLVAILAYVVGLGAAAAAGAGVVRRMVGQGTGVERQAGAGFTRFQSLMTVSFLASALAGRLDVFFLARLVSLQVVGWYQAAFRLFMPVQQLASSLSRVFAPRFASFTSDVEAGRYTRKAFKLSGGLALLMVLVIPFLRWGVTIIYGPEFDATVRITYILIWYFGLFLLSTPWWSRLLYYRSNAKGYALLALLQLVVLAGLLPGGILVAGAAGAAVVLAGTTLVFGLLAWKWSS